MMSSTEAALSVQSRIRRRPWNCRSRISALKLGEPAAPNTSCAPGFSFCPGWTSASQCSIVAAAQQQALHRPAARHPAAEQTRGKHARVVDDDEVARGEKVGQRREPSMCNGAGRAIQVKEPRRAPIGGRLLRDQAGRQVEVEIADVHPPAILAAASRRP